MALAALLVQAEPPTLTLGVVVFDLEADRGADSGEGVDHDADQRSVAETTDGVRLDCVEKFTSLVAREHGCLAALDDVSGTADGARRVRWHDLTNDEPVEQHPDGGKVLFHRWLGVGPAELLDVRGDDCRVELVESAKVSP